jgi:Family of unknown function (DUF6719)
MSDNRNVTRLIIGVLVVVALAAPGLALAQQQHVGREQDIVGLRLGQRVLVDDGTCPAGEVKEVSGAKMTATGVMALRKCVPRLGPKTK